MCNHEITIRYTWLNVLIANLLVLYFFILKPSILLESSLLILVATAIINISSGIIIRSAKAEISKRRVVLRDCESLKADSELEMNSSHTYAAYAGGLAYKKRNEDEDEDEDRK